MHEGRHSRAQGRQERCGGLERCSGQEHLWRPAPRARLSGHAVWALP